MAGLAVKIPLGFARRDFGRKLQATEKKRPFPYPKKVGSKPERCERVYKRTAEAQRDFLRGGGAKGALRPRGADELSSLRSANSVEFRIREIRSARTFQVLSILIKNGRPVRWTDLPFLVQVTGLEPA